MVNSTLTILVLALLAFLAVFVIPVLMTRLASNRVIKIFCQHQALTAAQARTPQDLGLAPLGFFDRLTKPRDYKQQALQYLRQTGVIQSTPDGRLYLSPATLKNDVRCRSLLTGRVRGVLKRRKPQD